RAAGPAHAAHAAAGGRARVARAGAPAGAAAGGRSAALLRAAAALVPGPVAAAQSGLQHPVRHASSWVARPPGSGARLTRWCDGVVRWHESLRTAFVTAEADGRRALSEIP